MSFGYYLFLMIAVISLFNGLFLSHYEKKYINHHKVDLMDDEII